MPPPIIPDLLDFFPDVVLVEPFLGKTTLSSSTYGTVVSHPAKVQGRHTKVRTSDGTEQVSSVNVLFAGVFGVQVRDRFTLPTRFSPTQPTPLAVSRATDENGAHHERVYFV